MKPGDLLYGLQPENGLPLVFRTRRGAESHLACLAPERRERCRLLTLRVEAVEGGASRDERAEFDTMPDATAEIGRLVGAERGSDGR